MARKDNTRIAAEKAAEDPSNLSLMIYDDGTYQYFCEAIPGTLLTDSDWRIMRMKKDATSQITWCNGNTNFDNVATDGATVFALNYS